MTQESTEIFHRVLEAVRAELRVCDEARCHCPHVRMEIRLGRIRNREAEQERRIKESFAAPAPEVAPVYTLATIPDSRLSLKE